MRFRLLLLALAMGCTSSHADTGPVAAAKLTQLTVTVTAKTCTMSSTRVPAGPLQVEVASAGAVPGSEVELLDSPAAHRVLGEEEAVHDGHTGGFTIPVTPGELTMLCLAGDKPISQTLTVVPSKTRHLTKAEAKRQQQLQDAAAQWHSWVQQQLDQLVVATKAFDDAVRAGNLTEAARLYSPARVFYERIEPVAESFGDLDPDIDARIDDVDDPALWTGFHRLEKAVFQDKSLKGMGPYATQLDIQVTQLDNLAKGIQTTGTDLANGATALLEEVARTKITGEEERYSRTDLVDLAANVEGSQKAFALLQPALREVAQDLETQISTGFDTVDTALAAVKVNGAYPTFDKVDEAKRQSLSRAIDGVTEPLSRVAALLAI